MDGMPTFEKWGNSLKEAWDEGGRSIKTGTFFALGWFLLMMLSMVVETTVKQDPDRYGVPAWLQTASLSLFALGFLVYFFGLFYMGWKYSRPDAGWKKGILAGILPALPMVLAGAAIQLYLYLDYDPFATPASPETGLFLMLFPLVVIAPPVFISGFAAVVRRAYARLRGR